MHVVPAGVHLSIGRGIGNAGGFLDRQPIEVCAQQGGRPIAIAENGDHTVPADIFHYLAVKIGEFSADAAGGALLFMGEFGVAM